MDELEQTFIRKCGQVLLEIASDIREYKDYDTPEADAYIEDLLDDLQKIGNKLKDKGGKK